MSKRFKYSNGYEGVVSDEVAAILEKKGQGKIIGEEKKKTLSADSRAKLVEKIVKANLGTSEEVAKLSDDDLVKLAKG